MDIAVLAGIKEDLLEFAYNTLINKGMYQIIFTFMKLETQDAD